MLWVAAAGCKYIIVSVFSILSTTGVVERRWLREKSIVSWCVGSEWGRDAVTTQHCDPAQHQSCISRESWDQRRQYYVTFPPCLSNYETSTIPRLSHCHPSPKLQNICNTCQHYLADLWYFKQVVWWWRECCVLVAGGGRGGPDQCSPLLLREIWHLSCHSWVWWTLLYLSQYLTTQLLAGASHRCLTFLHSSTLPPPHLVSLLQCHNHNIPLHHCLCQVWSNDIDPNDLHQTLYYTVSTTHWGLLSQYGWQQVNLINCWLN